MPAEAVGTPKLCQIVRADQRYLVGARHAGLQPHFDVVAVIIGAGEPAIIHIPNTFGV